MTAASMPSPPPPVASPDVVLRPILPGRGRAPRGAAPVGRGLLLGPLALLVVVVRWFADRPSRLVVATLLVGCLPVSSSGDVSSAGYAAVDVLSGVLVLAAALHLGRRRTVLPPRAALVFGAVVVALAVATIASEDPRSSILGFARDLQLFVLVPLAVVIVVHSRRDALMVGKGIVAVGVLEGVIGTYQALTGTGALYAGSNIRATGTFGPADIMGMSTVVSYGLLMALALGLTTRGQQRLLYAAVAVGLLVPLGLSFSRGAWIATAVAVAVMMLIGARRLLLGLVVGLVALTVLMGGLAAIRGSDQPGSAASLSSRLDSITQVTGDHPDQSVLDRYGLWEASLRMWADHPWTGVGIKNFPEYRDSSAPVSLSGSSDVDQVGFGFRRLPLLSSHSMYLFVLSEQGTIGGVGFFGLLGLLLVGALKRAWWAPPARWAGVGLAAIGLVVWQLVDFVYGDIGGPSSVFISLVLGVVAWWVFRADGQARPVTPAGPPTSPPPRDPVTEVRRRRSGSAAGSSTDHQKDKGNPDRPRRLVMRATALSMVLVAAGSVLGLARDLLVAGLFGANGETDAYLVGWTVSETASPLLIEGAMAFVMVPALSRALTARHRDEAVRAVVEGTLPTISLVLAAASAVIVAVAPDLVTLLAPGLQQPALAAECMRVVAVAVLLMGLTGYMSAVLRAHGVFGPPAAVTVVFNVGIIGTTIAFHQQLGVVASAIGISLGCALMVLVQLPGVVGRLPFPRPFRSNADHVTLWMFVPVGLYTITRQSQVFIERFLGSTLAPGTVSLLNYAQKIGQTPTTMSLLVATVTFPMLARSMALGRSANARSRLEADLKLICGFVLVSSVFLIIFAGPVVRLLFQRGQFTAADSEAAATILRVYTAGLVGQAIVDVMCRSYFSERKPSWFPAGAMGFGLVLNVVVGVLAAPVFGAPGIAAANAAGILLTAVILLCRSNLWRGTAGLRRVGRTLVELVPATAVAAAAGWGIAVYLGDASPLAVSALGGVGVLLAFLITLSVPTLRKPANGRSAARPPRRRCRLCPDGLTGGCRGSSGTTQSSNTSRTRS